MQCISKGKAHKRFEFGQKVSVATTNRDNWFVGALLCSGNPYDGHTLAAALNQVHALIGTLLTDVYVDKGYRGHDYQGDAMNVLLAAAGANFAKLLRHLPCALANRLNHWLAQQSLNRHGVAVLTV